jgi:predicted DNA binding CopG/RHH family protein
MSKEERELMDSIENEEWVEIEDFEEEKLKYEAYAAATLKDERVNIRIPGRDLQELKRKAIEEGLTYQALISTILHKFISGKFVEAK